MRLLRPLLAPSALTFAALSLTVAEDPQSAPQASPPASPDLAISWKDNILTVSAPGLPGDSMEILYLEAYCRPGSTDRDWAETVIGHRTELLHASPDGKSVKLRCLLGDGVEVEHTLTAGPGEIDFQIVAKNPSSKDSLAHWAQPCIRVGKFTGTQDDPDKYSYIKNCFVYLDGERSPLPTKGWASEARYIPGQVWAAPGVPRADVNPRPLNPHVPSNGLIGCTSADGAWTMATAFEPYQELFQGVIRCIHSDFRIGGLAPGESKKIRGKIYLQPGTPDAVLARYSADFPEHSKPK